MSDAHGFKRRRDVFENTCHVSTWTFCRHEMCRSTLPRILHRDIDAQADPSPGILPLKCLMASRDSSLDGFAGPGNDEMTRLRAVNSLSGPVIAEDAKVAPSRQNMAECR